MHYAIYHNIATNFFKMLYAIILKRALNWTLKELV